MHDQVAGVLPKSPRRGELTHTSITRRASGRAAGASTLIGAVPTNTFAALVLAARHGLQRVCVYGVPLIGVNSVRGFVTLQSVQVRTRPIRVQAPDSPGPLPSARLRRLEQVHQAAAVGRGVPHHALRIGEQLYETNQPLQP